MKKRLLLGLLLCFLSGKLLFAQDLTKDQVQKMADTMLIAANYKVKIKKIAASVNNIQMAVLEQPYREFPTILIFSKDAATGKWSRIFEGLNPGIQEPASGLHNWHDDKAGADIVLKGDTVVNFGGERIKQLIDATSDKKGTLIPYQTFLHIHTLGSDPNAKSFAAYTIDKTRYLTLGNKLFNSKYSSYSKKDCGPYDSPALTDATLEFKNDTYVITAKTSNGQRWTYTFTKPDKNLKYLENKTVDADNSK